MSLIVHNDVNVLLSYKMRPAEIFYFQAKIVTLCLDCYTLEIHDTLFPEKTKIHITATECNERQNQS